MTLKLHLVQMILHWTCSEPATRGKDGCAMKWPCSHLGGKYINKKMKKSLFRWATLINSKYVKYFQIWAYILGCAVSRNSNRISLVSQKTQAIREQTLMRWKIWTHYLTWVKFWRSNVIVILKLGLRRWWTHPH